MDTTQIDSLIDKISQYLDENKSLYAWIEKDLQEFKDASEEEKLLSIQLVLQYRLSAEDALSLLTKMDQSLITLLGIQPQNSSIKNLERLGFALGNEDLKQILNVLAVLTGYMFKILNRYENTQSKFRIKQSKKINPQKSFIQSLQKMINAQARCQELLKQLQEIFSNIKENTLKGPVWDHIAAIRGPINQFYQAILHGFTQTELIYKQMNNTISLDSELHSVLKNAENAFHLIMEQQSPVPHFAIKQFDQCTSEQLEQRASAKRLRPFFG